MDIDWGTRVITVYKTDTFVSFVGGSVYSLDTNNFRLAVQDRLDDEDGVANPDVFSHNTTVSLGGIEYARIIEVINGYTITFDDSGGAWVCNLNGSNNNILDVTNLTSVQVRSNNSAGLINVKELQQDIFSNAVWIDQLNGTPGVLYPAGTPLQPVNNFQDANAIANFRGFGTFRIIGDAVISTGDDVSYKKLIGENASRSMIIIEPNASTTGVEINNAAVTGTLDGSTILRDSYVFDLEYFNGFLFNCQLDGYISISGVTPANVMSCYGSINGVDFDLQASGHALVLVDFNGDARLLNKSDDSKVNVYLNSGCVHIMPSVTNGTGIHLDGVGRLVNNSGVEITENQLVSIGSVAAETLAQAEQAPIHSDVRRVNDVRVVGAGVQGNSWRPE